MCPSTFKYIICTYTHIRTGVTTIMMRKIATAILVRAFSGENLITGQKERKESTQLVTVPDRAAYASYKNKANT